MSFIASLWIFVIATSLQQAQSNVELVVTGDRGPIVRAQVVVSGRTSETNADGRVALQVAPGEVQITVIKEGFNPVTITVTATAAPQVVPVTLEPQETLEAHVTVSATRTGKRLEDQPMVYSGFRFVCLARDAGLPIAIVNRGRTRGDELAELKIEDDVGSALTAGLTEIVERTDA